MPKAAIIKPPSWKEQRQRGIEEKNTLKATGRKEVPNQMFREMNMKNTALQNIWHGNGSLREKCCLVIIPQPLTFIANTAWQSLSSSDLTSTCSRLVRDPLTAEWKFKLKLRCLLSFRMHWLCFVCLSTVTHSSEPPTHSLPHQWQPCINYSQTSSPC